MARPMFCLVKPKGRVRCHLHGVAVRKPAISESAVRIHLTPPSRYQPAASVIARSHGFADAEQNRVEAIAVMQRKAAKIGANGLLLGHRIDLRPDKKGGPRFLADRMLDNFPEGEMLIVAQAIHVPEDDDDPA